MATPVTLPALGESVTEGTVTRWLKQVGDEVAVDEPLLEVSTDKVDTEIPSPVAGTLLSIAVEEDETVEVGAELATIGSGEGGGAPVSAPEAEDAHEPPAGGDGDAPQAASQEPTPDPAANRDAQPEPQPEPAKKQAAEKPAPAAQPAAQQPAVAPSGGTTSAPQPSPLRGKTEPMTRLRKVIAKRMVESLQVSAQLTTVVEVDVTSIARLRDAA